MIFLFNYILLILGCVTAAAGFSFFVLPASLAPGGVSGIAVILNHLSGARVGLINLIINVPLFCLQMESSVSNF